MFMTANSYEGIPSRLYRAPQEIRRDIFSVKESIEEINDTLSVHNLLMEFLSEWSKKEPEKWIEELEEILCEAKESLERLGELKSSLDELKEELEDSRWAFGLL